MGDNIHGTFISEKPNKIRWKPEEFYESQTFITGSWDNEVNYLKLWTYKLTEDDPDIYPFIIQTMPILGDITEIKFINQETAVVATSYGYVLVVSVRNDQKGNSELKCKSKFDKLHHFDNGEVGACTALAVYDDDIATVGEDGRINLLNAKHSSPVQTIDNADSCSLKSICFLKHNEILTGNLRGQMKIWDLRTAMAASSAGNEPNTTFMLSGEQTAAVCLTHHPTQRHIVLAGGEDGAITIWDLRHNTYPVSILNAHTDTVTELMFHPHAPDKLFSCSASGEMWHWNANYKRITNKMLNLNINEENNIWLSDDLNKDKLEITSLMPKLSLPINTVDVNRNKVLCGCDNEAIYVINHVEC